MSQMIPQSFPGGRAFRAIFLFCFGIVAALIFVASRSAGAPSIAPTGLAALHVPPGFKIEKVAGSNLLSYPMMGTFDDRGRLFLCESSGNTLTTPQMAAKPDYVIRMLEDTDGDGVFDKSTIFADKLTLPAGAVWYRGSLYVAAPPDLVRLKDTDGDGVADEREVIVTGWNLSSNAASLHGPFFGPDGWLYLTDGRHGFNIKTKDGRSYEGLGSRIWRVRPDGTGLEWVAGGGFDNPVELVFLETGETFGTMTYFQDPRDGQRDAIMHWVWGGVYPKWFSVVSEFKRTGDLMPVMTKFARIAPAGLQRYRGTSFGPQYQGNFFSAQFNPHRVQRHILYREGATFRTEDSDFLTSADPDFHPTDVIEDADGSLLVVDTGAWFIHGCPISRVAKPEIKGGIYRIRRVAAPHVEDPRGEALKLATLSPADLARHLSDARPAVRDRALELLVEAGAPSVEPLAKVREHAASHEVRSSAVWGLYRIGTPEAQTAVRAALHDANFRVRVAAARAAGMARDREAVDRLMEMVKQDQPAARRQAATALGQVGDARAVPALISAAARADDRFLEHSVMYALIELKTPEPEIEALKSPNRRIRKAALIALDQMDGSPLTSEQLAPFLSDRDKDLRAAALWVVSHHSDWSGTVLSFLDQHLRAPEMPADEVEPVRDALLAICADSSAQKMVADLLGNTALPASRELFLLDTVDRCSLKEFPASWTAQFGHLLDTGNPAVRLRIVQLVRALQITGLDGRLEKIASSDASPADLRTTAIAVLVHDHPELSDSSLKFLLGRLAKTNDAGARLAAAQAIGKAKLTDQQLELLAHRYLPQADALILPSLLDAYRASASDAAGKAMVAALLKSRVSIGEPDAKRLQEILSKYPDDVRSAAKPLVAHLEELQKARIERLRRLEPLLSAGGDIGRGRRIFYGEKVACYNCHTIGHQGGHVGPDLTAVGAIRSGHDILEAIVFPSASFVPGFEIYNVETRTETYSGVRGEDTPQAVTLVTGPHAEVRIPRKQILSMKPSNVSLMPEGLDESLTKSEFVDLLAFLQAQKSREIAQVQPRNP
ncbi:MAG TPA: PVC-type heme-binding CxxCH protein [Bryobacteraceae bacterium]|nr:PVC-type heme-binding CxxCH protein [Bryobacteraceae bacterium]